MCKTVIVLLAVFVSGPAVAAARLGVRAGLGLRMTSRCSGTATATGPRETITLGNRAMVARRWAVEAGIALLDRNPAQGGKIA